MKTPDNKLLTLSNTENYINAEVFSYGIDNAILTESIAGVKPEGSEKLYPTNTFIIIFDSTNNEILATTQKLIEVTGTGEGDIYFEPNITSGGGSLVINTIDSSRTKNIISEDKSTNIFTADGFAIIRANTGTYTESDPDAGKFPDFSKDDWIVMVKSKLDNKPVFNGLTKFVFNNSTIVFGAADNVGITI